VIRDLTESAKLNSKVEHHGGTKYYLAPELWDRHPKFSKKCDVFASGIILIELITLKKPKVSSKD
jgi:serine/threonine protein kinase